jgi:general secretion pathway protein D
VKARIIQGRTSRIHFLHGAVNFCAAGLLLAGFPCTGLAQAASPSPANDVAPAPAAQSAPAAAPADKNTKADKLPRGSDRRRAARLFLEASKLFEKEQFQEALEKYRQAALLDPTNRNYGLASELARSHAVTALIQAAAKDRIRGDATAERAALETALALDPRNIQVTEHLYELGDDQARSQSTPVYAQAADSIGESISVQPTPDVHSFHLHTDQRSTIQQVFKAYGLQATMDDSIRLTAVRLDIDDATFDQAMRALSLLTTSFYVPLDAHRVLVARDTRENRNQFQRLDLETIYLPGLATADFTEVANLAKNVFDFEKSSLDPSAGTITVRGLPATMNAFNATIHELIDGHSQVLLDVNLIQIAHTSDRNTGVQPPQSISAFNVFAEEQSLLNANQALVQQIISSGLAAPGDTLAILGILLASGQVSSSLFSNGIALFGGGLTQSALSPGALSANLALNSSDSHELDRLQLRLADGQAGTVRSGTRYPIQTSSFSSLSPNLPNIPGLTGAGSSSSLSSLLSSLGSSVPNVPQVEYQDLGMTLKTTANVMRNNDVALTVDLKITALAGSSINGNPILDNRAYSGVVTLRQGEGVVVVSELDRQESRAISGVPGLSEIPGLNNVTGNDLQKSNSTLLIVMTPHVIRGPQASGHSPMMRVERTTAAH